MRMGFALAGGACAREAAGAVELAPRLGLGGQGCSPAHPLRPRGEGPAFCGMCGGWRWSRLEGDLPPLRLAGGPEGIQRLVGSL